MASSKHLLYLVIILANAMLTASFVYSDEDELIPYSTIRMRRRLFSKRRHRNICNLENDEKNYEKLREVVGKSDFVFTGKVVNHHHYERGDDGEENTLTNRSVEKRDGGKREKRRRLKKPPRGNSTSRSRVTGNARTRVTTLAPAEEKNSIEVNLSQEGVDRAEMYVVEIKRVIKGARHLTGSDKVIVKVPKEFVSGLEITSDPRLNRNCVEFHPVLKVRQTAILLAKKLNGSGYLELTYFPVAMTLRHLDRVDAAVTGTDKTYYQFHHLYLKK